MKNDSNKLTIEHIQKSVQHIEENKIELNKSTIYDVIINGKPYPPKEILRYSIQLFDVPTDWSGYGGQPTNKYFERMGFTIVKKVSNPLDKAIRKALSSNSTVQKALTLKDFYFQHALDVKEQIDNFSIEKEEALNIKKAYFKNTVPFEKFVETLSGKKQELSLLIGELISYLDLNASGKKLWNKYDDKRVIAKSSVRQPHWVNHIILSKFNQEHQSSHNIQKALDYIKNPIENYTILAASNRQNIYSNILNKEYKPSKFNQDLSDYFDQFDINPINPTNRTYIISSILYDKDVKKLWHNPDSKNNNIDPTNNIAMPLNQIFYGPPGTGKTYITINKAIAIANPKFDLTQKREVLKKEFDRLQTKGQIVFTTFHQSMNYEDFVEGIKPISPEEDNDQTQVTYEVQSGIFKNICNQARVLKGKKVDIDFTKVNFHKMSLGGKNRPDIHEWCILNNKLALGYGGEHDLSEFRKVKDWVNFRELFKQKYPELVASTRFNTQAAFAFIHMKPDDIVVISKGNHIIDAIGRVKSEYNYDNSNSIDYFHFRDVEWLATDMGASPEKFLKKNISQVTIYTFNNSDMKLDAYRELTGNESEEEKNYVLIIDEINRGNVSQIFGELITLIEPDKRQGKAEALELTLPYSKTKFGVPPNLHIIGTMNTADRSVEALDAALRRRFHFTEMPPDAAIIRRKKVDQIGDFNTADILETINNRIRILLDHDHLIGHSYFLKVKNIEDLRDAFVDRIIPLLQEYFYGDYSKIALVLGKGFCDIDEQLSKNDFAPGLDDFSDNYAEGQIFTLKTVDKIDKFTSALEQMGIQKNDANVER